MRKEFKLVFGIGNPGEAYERTYHNAGIIAVKRLASGAWNSPARKHFSYLVSGSVTYAVSNAYMNESGVAARELVAYFKKKPDELLVAHDDSDIRLGTYKYSFGRGSAGHAGIESIIAALGTDEFSRLRIGIRDAAEKRKAEDFVLHPLSEAHEKILDGVFESIRREFLPCT